MTSPTPPRSTGSGQAPPQPASLTDPSSNAFMEYGYQQMRSRAAMMAQQMSPSDDAKKLTLGEKLDLWDTRAMSIEEEWKLWQEGLAPEQIGLMVFPHRQDVVNRGGHLEPAEQIRTANYLAQKAAERRAANAPPPDQQPPPSLAPPPAAPMSPPEPPVTGAPAVPGGI